MTINSIVIDFYKSVAIEGIDNSRNKLYPVWVRRLPSGSNIAIDKIVRDSDILAMRLYPIDSIIPNSIPRDDNPVCIRGICRMSGDNPHPWPARAPIYSVILKSNPGRVASINRTSNNAYWSMNRAVLDGDLIPVDQGNAPIPCTIPPRKRETIKRHSVGRHSDPGPRSCRGDGDDIASIALEGYALTDVGPFIIGRGMDIKGIASSSSGDGCPYSGVRLAWADFQRRWLTERGQREDKKQYAPYLFHSLIHSLLRAVVGSFANAHQ